LNQLVCYLMCDVSCQFASLMLRAVRWHGSGAEWLQWSPGFHKARERLDT